MDFESANPTVVKSIKQRDLLNTWLRLFAREQKLPALGEYQPARIEDELPDLVYFSIDTTQKPPRIIIDSDGTLHGDETSTHRPFGEGRIDFEYLTPRLLEVPDINWWTIDMCFWAGSWDLIASSRRFVQKLLQYHEVFR